MKPVHVAREGFRLEVKLVAGKNYYRLTCGTCGKRSWWHTPLGHVHWVQRHEKRSEKCFEWLEEPDDPFWYEDYPP